MSSIKLVDKRSVKVENTGLKLEELDEKAVVYQSVFSRSGYHYENKFTKLVSFGFNYSKNEVFYVLFGGKNLLIFS